MNIQVNANKHENDSKEPPKATPVTATEFRLGELFKSVSIINFSISDSIC